MTLVSNIAAGIVALLHVFFLVLEMFLWNKPFGRRLFGMTPEFAEASKSLAANQGLQVEAIEPGEASGSVRYSTVPIRINGRGKYPQFAKFLRALREELPDTSVTDINLSGGGSTTAATSTLNLLWYAAPAPTVAKNETQ